MPLAVPKGDDVAALTDWAELVVLTLNQDGVSTTRLSRLLAGTGADAAEEELALDAPEGEEEDVELPLVDDGRGERELRIEQLIDEIELRLRLGPQLYPFVIEDERIARREIAGGAIYRFLLVLSSSEASYRSERRTHESEAAFDLIALEALRRYLGRNAQGVRFAKNAHDANDNETRPKKFREAVAWLRDLLKVGPGIREVPDDELEEHWESEPDAGALGRAPLNSYSDGGVDVVVWWKFADGRAGAPVLLAQCTVQLDWGDKVTDIKLELWEKWVDFDTVPPQTALVIPFAISRDSKQWLDRTATAGVIVDRLRILELLNELPTADIRRLAEIPPADWIQAELESLGTIAEAEAA